ncbi:MAG: hypothetical protein K2L51_00315 [Clostridiales bacterium]|nr:hypothetical protein [Clostridiales bacterium]
MTTQKALRKINEVITINLDKKIEEVNEIELLDLFAQHFYPKTYKFNKQKAVNKTNLDITVCLNRDYLDVNHKATTLDNFLTLTEHGAKRIEEKSDSLYNFLIRGLCAIGGVVGTVIASFLIELIKAHL